MPPNTENYEWILRTYELKSGGVNNEILAEVDYQMCVINGKIEIVINWDSFDNKTTYLTDNALKELITAKIAMEHSATGTPIEVKIVKSTLCMLKLDTFYKVEEEISAHCCSNPNTNIEELDTINNTKVKRATHYKKCGFKCCSVSYFVQATYDSFYNRYYYKILEVGQPTAYPGSECPPPSEQYIDCETGLPIVCEGNCN